MRPATEDDESEAGGIQLLDSLSKLTCEISNLREFRGPFRRSCCDLARRAKLLSPLFDEIRDGDGDEGSVEGIEVGSLMALLDAFGSAKDLLLSINQGSKLHQDSQAKSSGC